MKKKIIKEKQLALYYWIKRTAQKAAQAKGKFIATE